MSLSPNQLTTLKQYLDNNPSTYSGLNDQDAATTLNDLTVSRVKSSITGAEVFRATNSAEFDALTDTQRSEWLSLCSITEVDPANGTPAAATTQRLFGGGSDTQTNLINLRSETISPATEQGLPFVRAEDVRLARLLP